MYIYINKEFIYNIYKYINKFLGKTPKINGKNPKNKWEKPLKINGKNPQNKRGKPQKLIGKTPNK